MKNRTHDQARTVKSNDHYSTKLTTLKHGVPFTDSRKIATALGVKHAKVIEMIERLFSDYPDLRVLPQNPKKVQFNEVFQQYETEYRGQAFSAYMVNEPAFTLLLPRFETKRAKTAFREFNQSFYQMKANLLQAEANADNLLFQQLRIEGKTVRRNLTDVLKEFAEYSKEQGSKGSAYVYSNTTVSIYKAIDIYATDAPMIRDSLSVDKLQQLEGLEERVAGCIADGMESGMGYKLIKDKVKRTINQA
jgi:phage regulator Rha-like protein